ncbi:MAG: hypothetical protein J6386_18010 [Candidatus Synoicihabitans palmerolidicus]|nr:hypothetical protein [Candidatus Synoicihabitans palmerolidicus]
MVNQIEAEFDAVKSSLEAAELDLVEQETESLALSRASVDYDAKEREYVINKELHDHIVGRMRGSNMDNQNARIIDQAQSPLEGNYVSPNIILNLGLGFVGGAGLGLVFAFFIAFVDDRVKSSFDIESVIGLPLVGSFLKSKSLIPSRRRRSCLTMQIGRWRKRS